MSVEWQLIAFARSEVRVTRMVDHGNGTATLDIVAEQPEGAMLEALQPYIVPESEAAYWAAVARQRREQDRI